LEDLIEKILKTIPTYKHKKDLLKIGEEASKLKPFSKVLILGPGQGAETIVIKKMCPTCKITSIDVWYENEFEDRARGLAKGKFKIKFEDRGEISNTRQDYLKHCKDFDVYVDDVFDKNIYETKIIDEIGANWDFIYYDCEDNGEAIPQFYMIKKMLKKLWNMLNNGGILMGDDFFYFTKPDFKMTPIVESLFYELNDAIEFDFDNKSENLYWIIRKK